MLDDRKVLQVIMKEKDLQDLRWHELNDRSGTDANCMCSRWRTDGGSPTLFRLQLVLDALGLELHIHRKGERHEIIL